MSSSPVLLFLPGAFGLSADFKKPLQTYLDNAKIPLHTGDYLSVCRPGREQDLSKFATATCGEDIAHIRNNVLLPLLEAHDVVLVVHSYGGVVGGAASKGLDLPTRKAEGKTHGVIGLIYVAGNVTLEDEPLLEAMKDMDASLLKIDSVGRWEKDIPDAKGLAILAPAEKHLFNDVDAARAAELEETVLPHAYSVFMTKPSAPAWGDEGFDGRRVYVRTLDDNCNPTWLQDRWIEKTKVQWTIEDMNTSHMPFASQPEALAGLLIKYFKDFTKI